MIKASRQRLNLHQRWHCLQLEGSTYHKVMVLLKEGIIMCIFNAYECMLTRYIMRKHINQLLTKQIN